MSGSRRTINRRLGGLFAVALVALGACSGSSEEPRSSRDAEGSKAQTVRIAGFLFDPRVIEIGAATSVTWVQSDETVHTVTSGTADPPDPSGRSQTHPDGTFDSGGLDKGERFTHTFGRSGYYPYFCSRHPEGMRGEIVVK